MPGADAASLPNSLQALSWADFRNGLEYPDQTARLLADIGDVLRAQGNLPAALAAYKASHDIFERLAKAGPGNAGRRRDLSVSHNKIGDVLVEQGNLPDALAAYKASHDIFERLAKADPGDRKSVV